MTRAGYVVGYSDRLYPRERQILVMLADGKTRPEIAAELHIAPSTVKTHLMRAYRLLGARNVAHAIGIAYRQQIITLERPS